MSEDDYRGYAMVGFWIHILCVDSVALCTFSDIVAYRICNSPFQRNQKSQSSRG